MEVRVRFAPSPTGSLHVGGARTALYNLLFARANKGRFILRVEDTDQARSTESALESQIQDLKWLGLNWDEGPDKPGAFGPYRQSQRQEIYNKIAHDLIDQGKAYYCFLTDVEVEDFRAKKQPWNSPYRDLAPAEAKQRLESGAKATIRFRTSDDEKIYQFNDMVRGPIELASSMVGDFVIIRSDGMPVYNFCCAIDDHLMKITHVFRGEEHLSNTLRQLMIYESMSAKAPEFGHLSIILGEDKKKLSKRQGAVSCDSFRSLGYLPEALVNYIALLGWSPKTEQEIFSLKELSEIFKAEQLNAAAPIFDSKKLDWLNSQHMRALKPEVLFQHVEPLLLDQEFSDDLQWQSAIMHHLVTDANTLNDIKDAIQVYLDSYVWQVPQGFTEIINWDHTKSIWQYWQQWLVSEQVISAENIADVMQHLTEKYGVKGKQLFMPLRAAVIGQLHGADVRIAAPLISRASLLKRVKACRSAE